MKYLLCIFFYGTFLLLLVALFLCFGCQRRELIALGPVTPDTTLLDTASVGGNCPVSVTGLRPWYDGDGVMMYVNVRFKNNSVKEIKYIDFAFEWVDVDGAVMGEFADPLREWAGRVAPGATCEGKDRGWDVSWTDTPNASTLRARVVRVDWVDGTTWIAPTPLDEY